MYWKQSKVHAGVKKDVGMLAGMLKLVCSCICLLTALTGSGLLAAQLCTQWKSSHVLLYGFIPKFTKLITCLFVLYR